MQTTLAIVCENRSTYGNCKENATSLPPSETTGKEANQSHLKISILKP